MAEKINCIKCKKPAKANLKHQGPLCKECFNYTIERRIRKYVRVNKLFKKDDKLVVKGTLTKFLIKKIIKDLPITIKYTSTKGYKTVEDRTMDDEIYSFFNLVFNNKPVKFPKTTSIIHVITDEEAVLFAKFNNLSFKPKSKPKQISDFLEPISKKHAETKFSILSSIDNLKKIGVK